MRSSTDSKSVHSLSSKSKTRRAPWQALAAAIEALEPRRLLSAGQLDPTFGSGGKIADPTHPGANSVVVQTDGKVVEAGLASYGAQAVLSLARFNVDGTPDQSFGYLGGLTQVLGPLGYVGDLAIQPDGKIIVFASAFPQAFVERFLANGQIDTTFGTGGKISVAANASSPHFALQPDGKIDLAGVTPAGLAPDSGSVTVTRFNSDGSLDTAFGTGGTASSAMPSRPFVDGIAIQTDGTIVVVGGASEAPGVPSPFAARFTSSGGAATGFGGALAPFTAVAAQGNKDIVFYQVSGALERHNPDGSLDPTFTSIPNSSTNINKLVIQPDGKILASGYTNRPQNNVGGFVVERFNADGTLDTTFGNGGSVSTDFSDHGSSTSIALAPSGAIVAVGGTAHQLDIVRFTGDGGIIAPTGASISGNLYNDANGNGQRDPGEAPVAGRQVYLDLNGIGVFATGDPISTTDAAGHYSFLNLPPKNYLVRLVPQSGTVITMPLFGGKYFVQLGANQTVTGDDFGTQAVGSPSFPLAGGQLLVSGSANAHNTLTRYNADGSTDVSFGTYGVVTLPGNVVGVPSNALSQPNGQIVITYPTLTVTLSATGAIVSISSISGGTIRGQVYNDANANHARDLGEGPVAGRQVYLDIPGIDTYVAGDPVALTDANGNYSFGGLAAGNYLVRLVPVSGQVVSSPIFGGKYYVQLGANQTATSNDFGTVAAGPLNLTMPDGKLLVVNPFYVASPFNPLYDLTRYNPDGGIDTTFGTLGSANLGATSLGGSPGAGINQLLLRPDGGVLVGWVGTSHSSITNWLTLLGPSGAVLKSGVINFNFMGGFGFDSIEAVSVTADNKVVVAYQHDDPTPAHSKFVRRYNADLTLDTTFGVNGQATVTGAPNVPLTKMTPLANGETVLNYGGTLLLLQSNGSVDTTNAVALLPDGKLLVGGQIFRTATLTRYNADGSVDTTFNGGTSYEGYIHQIILLPNGAYVLWEQGGRGPLHESVEFITSFGQSKGTQTVAVNTSGNSGNTTQTITSVRAINGGVEVIGTQVQTIYSFSQTIPNTVITTPIDAMYFVGYTNQ
jgi:uncharacterized delta-60 repeat protein